MVFVTAATGNQRWGGEAGGEPGKGCAYARRGCASLGCADGVRQGTEGGVGVEGWVDLWQGSNSSLKSINLIETSRKCTEHVLCARLSAKQSVHLPAVSPEHHPA